MGDSDFFTGTLALLILRTLQDRTMHGYEVGRALREHSSGVFEPAEGVLYTALHRMEEKGLVEARWGASDTGRKAKYYSLTTMGARNLEESIRAWERFKRGVSSVLDPERGPA